MLHIRKRSLLAILLSGLCTCLQKDYISPQEVPTCCLLQLASNVQGHISFCQIGQEFRRI